MKTPRFSILLLLVICLSASLSSSFMSSTAAQNGDVTVPDLTGLNIPQAAALLNKNGLAMGKETSALWSEDTGVPVDTIGSQSVAPGATAAAGSTIDVTVLHATNVTLLYDDNDITFINRAASRIDLKNITFSTLQARSAASFNASRWAGRVRPGYCTQLWSVSRNQAKDVEGCTAFEQWISTRNPAEHFWTAANGVQNFDVVQDGIERAICDAAAVNTDPVTCDFYLETAGNGNSVEFVYFAYTTTQLVIYNRSPDNWMRLSNEIVYNQNPNGGPFGKSFEPGKPDLFGKPDIVAKIQRLAPNQCLLFKAAGDTGQTPQACDVIATLEVEPQQTFWTYDFELQSSQDNKRRVCRAATPDKLTICILPR